MADAAEIRQALSILIEPGQVTELRALGVSTREYRRPHTEAGYFDDMEALVEAAESIDGLAKGIYVIPNPINPMLLARSANRLQVWNDRDPLTSDKDIIARHWLLVDIDSVRPANISASEAEHAGSITRALEVRAYLRSDGWADPIIADSGNGAHLLYRVRLPLDDGGLTQRVLTALAFRFSDNQYQIDQSVYNPARIWKLYGTTSRKGDSTKDRPHRLARILEVPT